MRSDRARTALALALGLLGQLPLGALRGLGRTIGLAADFADTRQAQTSRTNLALCMPHLPLDQRRRLARQSLIATASLAMEMGLAWTGAPDRVLALVDDGPEIGRYLRPRGSDQGLLLLVPHLGNWEVLNLWLQASMPSGCRFTALFDPARDHAIDAWVRDRRMRTGALLVPATASGIRTVLRTLHGGGVVGVLPDQVPPRPGGVHAPFFGHSARTMTLVQRLLQRTGAEALASVALRRAGGFTLRFLEPTAGLVASDPVLAATALNATVERCVALAPSQYQWEYKRFKHPAQGAMDHYKGVIMK